jgi:hypothetical protein
MGNEIQSKMGTSSMEPMQARMWIWDYKIKYCMKVSSKTALAALLLPHVPLSFNTY